METCAAFRSVDPFVGASQLGLYRPIRQACTVLFYSFNPLPVARPSTIHSAPYISRSLRGGSVLHLLSVSPFVETNCYCTFYQWRPYAALYWSVPPLRLYILSVGPSVVACTALSISQPLAVEALYCSLYQSAHSRVQSGPTIGEISASVEFTASNSVHRVI